MKKARAHSNITSFTTPGTIFETNIKSQIVKDQIRLTLDILLNLKKSLNKKKSEKIQYHGSISYILLAIYTLWFQDMIDNHYNINRIRDASVFMDLTGSLKLN